MNNIQNSANIFNPEPQQKTGIYKGEEFEEYQGYKILIEDDEDMGNPCYRIYLGGEWLSNMFDEDIQFD